MGAALAELAARKDRACAQLRSEHDRLVELVKTASARGFGAKSEKALPFQHSPFNDVEAAAPAPAPEPAPKARKKRKPKKKVGWASFETAAVEHGLPGEERGCPACGRGMEPMGYEVKREFVYVPARVEVREHRVAKYACRECSKASMADGGETPAPIVGAPGPALPLPGTWASAELLAHVMKQKYQLAMPVYRIANDLSSQQGLPVSRQAMAGWAIDAYDRWLSPTYSLMRDCYAAKKMKLYEALDYAIGQWPAIMTALEDGRLPIDNNRAEQAIRPLAVGRRNWLFSDTQAGAHASAGIYSIVTTARANGLKTYGYLEWALSEMPRAEAAGELDPARFLPWSPDVPERCRAPKDDRGAVFEGKPLVDIDPADYEEVAG